MSSLDLDSTLETRVNLPQQRKITRYQKLPRSTYLNQREIRKLLSNHLEFKMSVVLQASGDAASVASTRQNPDEVEDFNIVDIDALQQHGINVADIKVFILPCRPQIRSI